MKAQQSENEPPYLPGEHECVQLLRKGHVVRHHGHVDASALHGQAHGVAGRGRRHVPVLEVDHLAPVGDGHAVEPQRVAQ